MLGGLLNPEFRPDHLLPFGVIAAVKLAGWAVKLLFSFCYRPDAPEHSGEHTPYLAAHTTLVCPVLSPSLPALKLALYSWVACRPSSILIVASVNEADQIERAVSEARELAAAWETLEGRVDAARFEGVRARFAQQVNDARVFAEIILNYYAHLQSLQA